jgi:myo-inositol-1(or 4)-monophosphatase
LEDLYSFAVKIAVEAGHRLAQAHGTITRSSVNYKGWRNLVTALDLEVEEMLISRIRDRFPEDSIRAEEGGGDLAGEQLRSPSSHRWVIDPLDGTTNYVHRHPFYCVSIGVEDASGPLVGVVFAPRLDELFAARRGRGATLNGESIHVSEESDLSRALLASGFAYAHGTDEDQNLRNWARLAGKCRGLRRCGSAALDLAYVADGRFDGFWELGLSPWDVAAGALLVQEAGGEVTDCVGGPSYHDGTSIAASNGAIHAQLLENLTA